MKLIASFFVLTLFIPGYAHAVHPWTDVVGCYKTIIHNGQEANPNGAQSTIRDVDDLAVITDALGKKLAGLEMIIVQGYDADADEMHVDYQAALTGKGTYSASQENPPTRSFAFDGLVRFQDMPPMRVKANVSAKWMSSTRLELKTKRVVVGSGGDYDTNDSYVLQKEQCQN